MTKARFTEEFKDEAVKQVIGHHDEEGIVRFLRERFALEES